MRKAASFRSGNQRSLFPSYAQIFKLKNFFGVLYINFCLLQKFLRKLLITFS